MCLVLCLGWGREGSGEGLYAQRDLKKGEIVAFYNGVSNRGEI